jgi:putative spermidine/putrescine transport system ATP-binding protein
MVSAEVTPFPQPATLQPDMSNRHVAVRLDGVLKRFGDAIALHKISLMIEEGNLSRCLARPAAAKPRC